MVATQAKDDSAESITDNRDNEDGTNNRNPRVDAMLHAQDRGSVSAEPVEGGMAK
jgi:hypothetical protein